MIQLTPPFDHRGSTITQFCTHSKVKKFILRGLMGKMKSCSPLRVKAILWSKHCLPNLNEQSNLFVNNKL